MNTSTIKLLMPVYFSEEGSSKAMMLVAVEQEWDVPLPRWLGRGRQAGSGFMGEYLLKPFSPADGGDTDYPQTAL